MEIPFSLQIHVVPMFVYLLTVVCITKLSYVNQKEWEKTNMNK